MIDPERVNRTWRHKGTGRVFSVSLLANEMAAESLSRPLRVDHHHFFTGSARGRREHTGLSAQRCFKRQMAVVNSAMVFVILFSEALTEKGDAEPKPDDRMLTVLVVRTKMDANLFRWEIRAYDRGLSILTSHDVFTSQSEARQDGDQALERLRSMEGGRGSRTVA